MLSEWSFSLIRKVIDVNGNFQDTVVTWVLLETLQVRVYNEKDL